MKDIESAAIVQETRAEIPGSNQANNECVSLCEASGQYYVYVRKF